MMKNNKLWLYAGVRANDGALLQYSFDRENCRLDKNGIVGTLHNVAFLICSGNALYASSLDEMERNLFSAYEIADDGAVCLLNRTTGTGFDATHMALNRHKGVLVASDFLAHSLLIYEIRKNGALGACRDLVRFDAAGSEIGPRQDSPHPHCTAIAEDGSFLLTADLGCDRLWWTNLAGQSSISGSLPLKPGSGPRHIALHPSMDYAYLISEISSDVFVFRIGKEANKLELIQQMSNLRKGPGGSIGGDITLSPDGRFLLASNRGENTVVVYRICGDGRLEYSSYAETDGWVRILHFDSRSEYHFAGLEEFLDVGAYTFSEERCRGDGGLQVFKLDETAGALLNTGIREYIPRAYAFAISEGEN